MNRIIIFNEKKYNFYETLQTFYKNKYSNFNSFENIHNLLQDLAENDKKYYDEIPIFGYSDRNSVFVKDFYNFIDSDYSFLYSYLDFIQNEIKPLFPNEIKLIVQKTPNIRFHLPKCTNIGKRTCDYNTEIIGLHSDGEFGHPNTEFNIVLPITRMFDTNTMYYEPYPNSNINPINYENMKLEKNNFFIGYLNQCKHYNKINETNQTRVSFDFRIIPYSKFIKTNTESATNKIKFDIGKYYMLI